MVLAGKVNCGVLKALKNSDRKTTYRFSARGNFFTSVRFKVVSRRAS